MTTRPDGRTPDQLRPVTFQVDAQKNAFSSVLTTFGNTTVLTSVSVDDKTRPWRDGLGWVTAEYAMLPGSSSERISRDRRGPNGRATEIERLIGRSLRAGVNLDTMPAVTLRVDCDVIDADGGTRTAAITGAWVALARALHKMDAANALIGHIAAVSVGIVDDVCVLDLPYAEDVRASVDMNVVMTDQKSYVEVQGTAEADPYTKQQLDTMLELAAHGITKLVALQAEAVHA